MFERNRIDNSRELGAVGVEITLADGSILVGKLMTPVSIALADMLNGPAPFFDFEPYAGEKIYLAKSSVRAIRPLAVDRVPALANRVRDVDGFDPWVALGLQRGAGIDNVKAAFHRAAFAYHPDRYANAELPAEVRDYLAAMSRRINSAYTTLTMAHDETQRNAALRTAPIYASGNR